MRNVLGDLLQTKNLLANAQILASANGSGVDVSDLDGSVAVTCAVSAPVAGTNPTLDLKLQHSDDDGANDAYADVTGGAFAQVTSAASKQKLSLSVSGMKKYVRVVKTIGGTSSPQYYASVSMHGLKQYLD
jgi:hypothetical protein